MSDYQTQQRRRNMIVGGFVLLGLTAFIWMLVKFRNLPLFATKLNSFVFYVYFPDAPGIGEDTPVNYCGQQVGRVMSVEPPRKIADAFGQPQHFVRVDVAIDNKFSDIPNHAEIYIVKRGLGSSYLTINVDPEEPVDGYLEAGMTKYGAVSTASEFFPPEIQKKLVNLVDSITALSDNANSILGDEENKAHIKQTLDNITEATARAQETLASVQQFSDAGAQRLNEVAAKLDQTLASIRNLSEIGAEHIETVAFSLQETLGELRIVLAKLHSGDGSAAKLINDGRFYENLLDSSLELEMALEQIKRWAAEAREKGIRIKW